MSLESKIKLIPRKSEITFKSEKFPKLSHSLINVTTKAEEKQLCFDKSFSTNQKDNENKTCEE